MKQKTGSGAIIKESKSRIEVDMEKKIIIGMTIKNRIHIMRPKRKWKYFASKRRIVQNKLCGAFFEQTYRFMGGTQSFLYSYEWVPCIADVKKMRSALPRIRISYTEEELEYFRIMKEMEEEKKHLKKIAS